MSTLSLEEQSISPESRGMNIAVHAVSIITFSTLLVILYSYWKRKHDIDVDRYLTARRRFGWIPMSLSFFAASGGAWTIFGIPSYVSDPVYGIGLGGLLVLAISNCFSVLAMSLVGPKINKRFPTITSWNDFASKKFGPGAQAMVAISSLISIFSSFIAEYTGTAKLMHSLYHIPQSYSIISTGLLTMAYSAILGVSASLFTDYVQTVLMFILLIMGFALLNKYDLSSINEPQNSFLGFSAAGFDSIFTIGIGTFSYYLFSDMCWQRLIANESSSSTRKSTYAGAVLTFLSIMSIGIIAIISVATTDKEGNQELRLYYSILSCQGCASAVGIRALKMIVMIMAIIINATSIDNCQSCITATITSYILAVIPSLKKRKTLSITFARLIQLISNLMCIVVATANLRIISFYLVSTLIASSLSAPFIVAFNETASKYLSSLSVLLVFILTMSTNIVYYYIAESRDPISTITTYYFDEYRKETFIICVFAPYVYTLIICYITSLVRSKKAPPLSSK